MDNVFLETLSDVFTLENYDSEANIEVYDNVRFVYLTNGDFRALMYSDDGQIIANYDSDTWNLLKSEYDVDEYSDGSSLKKALLSYRHDLAYSEYELEKQSFPDWFQPDFDTWLSRRNKS